MKTKMSMLISLILVAAGGALAADPMDTEMFPLLEKARSAKQAERQDAVRGLLALREAVSDELTEIVIDANNGHAESGSKASALFLMGELGLMQCKHLLEREKDWQPTVEAEEMMWLTQDTPFGDSLMGQTAKESLNRACFANNVTLIETREKTALTRYPNLAGALDDLRSPDWRKRHLEAEPSVLRWCDVVCRSMHSVLKPAREAVYSNEVKATAAFVLGEYRSRYRQMLLWNIDLKDQNDVCSRYPHTLTAQAPEPQYPCAVALIKLGYRANISGAIGRIETKPQLSRQTRDRIARVLVAIDKDATQKLYDAQMAGFENIPEGQGTPEERQQWQSRLQLLRTIEPIIKQ